MIIMAYLAQAWIDRRHHLPLRETRVRLVDNLFEPETTNLTVNL